MILNQQLRNKEATILIMPVTDSRDIITE